MPTVTDIGTMIMRTPGIRSGRPHLAGMSVSVQRIATWYQLGVRPEDIAERIGHLSSAQVFAALAYYFANREVIDDDIALEETEADHLEAQHVVEGR
jgi:uncharacterized protein (DUF433 family)